MIRTRGCFVWMSALFAWSAAASCFAGEMAVEPPHPYPPLTDLVQRADLILLGRRQSKRGEIMLRVATAWKGTYQPKMFADEYAGCVRWHGNNTLATAWDTRVPAHESEIHFLKLDRGTGYITLEAFPIINGKITYPKTVRWGKKPGAPDRTYTVEEFRSAVARLAAQPGHGR